MKLTFEFLVEFVNRVNQDEFGNSDPYLPSLTDTTRRNQPRVKPQERDTLLHGFIEECNGKTDAIPPKLRRPTRELGWLWDLHFYVDLVRLRKNIEKGTVFGKGILLIPDSPRMLRGNPSQEELDARAQKALESIPMSDWDFMFHDKGDVWEIGSPEKRIEMPDLKGLHDIEHLLKHPMEKINSLELRKLSDGAPHIDANAKVVKEYETMTADQFEEEGMSARVSLDPAIHPADDPALKKALKSYRKRLHAIEEEKKEAEGFQDWGKVAALEDEEEKIRKHISHDYGFGGKPRSTGEQELARKAIKKRIDRVITQISEKHPALGKHLRLTIKTGTQSYYGSDLDDLIRWKF